MDVTELVKITENFNVLYIEDDINVQEGTKKIFENLFLLTDIANNGKEGLEKYIDFYERRKFHYDLVISDINMPVMDGILMSEKILEINSDQVILAISAYNDSDKLVRLIDIGVSNFIHKPIEMDSFLEILNKLSSYIIKHKDFEKNFDEIKKLNTKYNNTIENYDKFVIAARTDLDGNFVDVSEAYENISGYTKDELIGRNANILRNENTSEQTYKELWHEIKNGRIWNGEICNKRKNGETYWINSTVSAYIDEQNNIIGYNAISEDISKQKKIESLSIKLQTKNEKLKDLLDNTEQGFLSCNKEMLIEKDYSLKCEEILGKDLENKDISKLLFPDDYSKQDTFKYGFDFVIKEEDILKREQIFSLMPQEQIINDMTIKLEYKLLSDKRVMIILTNLTENRKLSEKIENERIVYRMIIAVIVNSNQFWEVKKDFIHFLEGFESLELSENSFKDDVSNLLYKLHTFKGLFSQKELIYTPKAIHAFEDKIHNLIDNETLNPESIKELLEECSLKESLNKDISLITNILGEEFLNQNSYLKINVNRINEVENKIKSFQENTSFRDEPFVELLNDVNNLKKHRLRDIINSYARQVELIAGKLSKKILKVEVSCDKDILVEDYFSSFVKALVHIFRNTIIHGIEEPDLRVSLNKNIYGKISSRVRLSDDSLIIDIEDDGKGLDLDLIKHKASKLGYEKEQLTQLSKDELYDLIFHNHISTYKHKDVYAGCGFGLGAVREELEKINGKYIIENRVNEGLQLSFIIPIKKD